MPCSNVHQTIPTTKVRTMTGSAGDPVRQTGKPHVLRRGHVSRNPCGVSISAIDQQLRHSRRLGRAQINGLENGAQQLSHWFSHIELQRLPVPIVVKDAEPLVTFIRSGVPQDQYNEAIFQRLREHIQQKLSQHGEIRITMDIGVFEATGSKL